MRDALPSWRTRCANLAKRHKDEGKQELAVYSDGTENRERGRNKRADCKTITGTKPPDPETETAAQAGPLNGGNKSEKHSSAFKENSYHETGPAATRAGLWYAENRENCPRPVVPALRLMFDLSALEAVQAIRVANGVPR
jgi:hypothetical protein